MSIPISDSCLCTFFLSEFQSSRHWSLYFFGNFQSCFLHFSRDAASCWWVFKQLFEKGLVYRTSSHMHIYIYAYHVLCSCAVLVHVILSDVNLQLVQPCLL